MEFGPTMIYSYYERRLGRQGANSIRAQIQVGKFHGTGNNLTTGFQLLKGTEFERYFDLTHENLYKIANIIKGNRRGALEQNVAEGSLNEFAPAEFNGGDDGNDLQLYLDVAKKLDMKKYKPGTAHNLIAQKMAELVDSVDDEKIDWARHMARKEQGLPSMLDQQGLEEAEIPQDQRGPKPSDIPAYMRKAAGKENDSAKLNDWLRVKENEVGWWLGHDVLLMHALV